MNLSSHPHPPKGYYQFALYGRTGSGKTCVLATMARGTVGSRNGLTCTRLPVDVPPSSDDPEAQALHRGKQWIDEAAAALDRGELPSPNRPEDPGASPLVEFALGTSHRGMFRVRIIDYAGELINSEDESNPQSLATKLKKTLQRFDGLIVMAEAPRAPTENGGLGAAGAEDQELRRLSEAFASLNKADLVLHMPVALMITKWDRRSAIDPGRSEEEVKKLAAFLEQHPVYATLRDCIRNATALQAGETAVGTNGHGTPIPGGLQFDNCAVFASSAFGKPDLRNGKEFPSPTQGFCFGLLEPFVWMADRRDALDAAAVQQRWQAAAYVWWLPWPFPGRKELRRQTGRLLRRVPPKSPAEATLRRILKTLRLATLASWFLFVLLVASLVAAVGSLGLGYLLRLQFDRQRSIAARADASLEELENAREWFRTYPPYPLRPYLRLLLLAPSTEDAKHEEQNIDQKIEARIWSQFTSAKTPEQKYKAAKDYLHMFPSGPHAQEARTFIADYEAEETRRKNGEWLDNRNGDLEKADLDHNALSKLDATLQEGFPYPDAADENQRRRLQELQSQCATNLKASQWQQYREKVGTAMHEGDWF